MDFSRPALAVAPGLPGGGGAGVGFCTKARAAPGGVLLWVGGG
jgi:hypothetical protein